MLAAEQEQEQQERGLFGTGFFNAKVLWLDSIWMKIDHSSQFYPTLWFDPVVYCNALFSIKAQ
jgi:hypothetical protein